MQSFDNGSNNFKLRKYLDIDDVDKEIVVPFRAVYTFFKQSVDGSFFVVVRIRSPPILSILKFKKLIGGKNGKEITHKE